MFFLLAIVFLVIHVIPSSSRSLNVFHSGIDNRAGSGSRGGSSGAFLSKGASQKSNKFAGMNAIVHPGDQWANDEPPHCRERLERFGDTGPLPTNAAFPVLSKSRGAFKAEKTWKKELLELRGFVSHESACII